MTKQKKSFFEKLTGIKKITDEDQLEELELQESPEGGFVTQFESQESDMYEFPEQAQEEPQEEQEIQQYIQNETMQQPQQEFEQPIESEGQLTIDVYQTNDDIVIKSTIAGVKPENLDVNINNDMVTIRGERQQDEEISVDNYYYQECYWGPFSRSVILPVEIISDKAEATMKNGILTLKLPKADTTKTRKIQVRGF
ncbi:Hsp20/alpha crystallin family protein [bacterium]|jgi:HSP20 family protein|nr:Hsp20/alpha crystallin family protein [bacterium]MBT4250846.1 Hsp20/alpha crystallin family protein [bacterium]MBT4597558.1 Hsp20/alpha crystallin family protein [bacterium]MBT6754024.1 Hsp20/alpha crystallin family protein [bacterium]MBT7038054.1 Hsp20/alpha crystallin family protein [bacterium]